VATTLSTSSTLKRGLDLLAALVGFVVVVPVLIIVSLTILLFDGRPVFFVQERIGRDEKPFRIYKFRTLTPSQKRNATDQRLTRTGSFLRLSSIDELPQLVNVIRGDMSLVGPRPLLPRYLPYYKDEERLRHTVRPGITGWAQTKGRNTLSWDERLSLDVWYVRNRSLGLDLRIFSLTFGSILTRKGIVVRPETAMQDLDQERMNRLKDD
jgi:lipopolysaccharide/colanic/teichoic acid biosynthesis glycosyltransferase